MTLYHILRFFSRKSGAATQFSEVLRHGFQRLRPFAQKRPPLRMPAVPFSSRIDSAPPLYAHHRVSIPLLRFTRPIAYRSRSSALRAPPRIDPAPPPYAPHRVSIPLLRFTRPIAYRSRSSALRVPAAKKAPCPPRPSVSAAPVFTPLAQTARKILKACVFLLTNVPENDIVIKRAGA